MKAVYYCTEEASHQLICAELCSTLVRRGHSVVVVAQGHTPQLDCLQHHYKVIFRDCPVEETTQQRIGLESKQGLVDAEAAWLRAHKTDVVISAAVSFGCAAAAAAGVCAVCIAHSTGGEAAVNHYKLLLHIHSAKAASCWRLLYMQQPLSGT